MTTPKYPHKWLLSTFLGHINMNGHGTWDVYASCNRQCVIFCWGPEGYDYFAGSVTGFPLEPSREHDKYSERTHPPNTVINDAWRIAAKRWWG